MTRRHHRKLGMIHTTIFHFLIVCLTSCVCTADCRQCGENVCGSCSKHRILLLLYDSKRQVRVCDTCYSKHVDKPEIQIDVTYTASTQLQTEPAERNDASEIDLNLSQSYQDANLDNSFYENSFTDFSPVVTRSKSMTLFGRLRGESTASTQGVLNKSLDFENGNEGEENDEETFQTATAG